MDWSRWDHEGYGPLPQHHKLFAGESFARQMCEIEGEIGRVLRSREKLEAIRSDPDYRGEPQIIHMVFEAIKTDPKNVGHLEEVKEAEELTLRFLTGAPDAPSPEELAAFWGKYMEEYLRELGDGRE